VSHSKELIFLTILKNSKKTLNNIKFGLRLDIHMKIISYSWIDHLHFDNEEPIHSTIAKLSLSLYIYIYKGRCHTPNKKIVLGVGEDSHHVYVKTRIHVRLKNTSSKFEPHNHRRNMSDKSLSAVLIQASRYYISLGLDLKSLKIIL
jgi:hypothetical protein